MRFSKFVAALAFVAALIGLAPSAHAQQMVNLGFGYQFLHSSQGGEGTNFPAGFFVDAAGQLTPSMKALNWVGELSWSRHAETDFGTDISVKATTFAGGVRYSFLQNMAYTPWVQVLVGAAHTSISPAEAGNGETKGLIGFDGGIDYPLKNGWNVRGGVGYARVFTEGEGTNVVRVHAGVSTSFPRK